MHIQGQPGFLPRPQAGAHVCAHLCAYTRGSVSFGDGTGSTRTQATSQYTCVRVTANPLARATGSPRTFVGPIVRWETGR